MKTPTVDDLVCAIQEAAENAIRDLFKQHPGHFYYCSLISTGEAHPPELVAWSKEMLVETVQNDKEEE